MKKYIPLLVILCACETIVDIDVPFKHVQLTVNSFFTPDSIWSADITLNRSVLDNHPFKKVNDALVVIYGNGVPLDTLQHLADGRYISDTGKPLANERYEIKVSAPGQSSVSSQVNTIFSPAKINSVQLKRYDGLNYDEQGTTITIKFNDNPAEVNYYEFLLEEESEYVDFESRTVYTKREAVRIKKDEPTTDDQGDYYSQTSILSKDVLFNGKEAELSFKTRSMLSYSKAMHITLRTVTEAYFKYKTTAQLQEDTSGDPFAQPVNVYNNINNGFGIFAGYSQSTYSQETPVPEITSISPMTGKAGDHFVITGKNFSDSRVSLGFEILHGYQYPKICQVVSATETEIEAIVPTGATTDKIVIRTSEHYLVSDDEFVVDE